MKKIICKILFICLFATQLFSQDSSLYDVNYDKPIITSNFDESSIVYQDIYLQYETAINTLTNVIRQEEKDAYDKAISEFKKSERLRTDTTIEKMRQAIYNDEIESVRLQEIERLTEELTEKISTELQTKLSSDYEKKKNDEIAELYANLKKEAYVETHATTQRFKSITTAVASVIIIILIFTLLFLGIRGIYIIIQQKGKEKEKIDTLVNLYSYQLKDYNGNTHPITEKIQNECKKNEKEKNLRIKALKIAENQYSGDLKEIQEYKNEFDTYKSTFLMYIGDNVWKNKNFNFIKISDELNKIYKNYKNLGQELFYSLKSRTDADKRNAENLLSITSSELKDLAKDINNKNIERQFLKDKKQLAKIFTDLAKTFKKGDF